MKTTILKSRTYHTLSEEDGQGVLLILKSDRIDRIDVDTIYEEEAKQIADFLNSILSVKTMEALQKLLPKGKE
jgi:hypothetical protein